MRRKRRGYRRGFKRSFRKTGYKSRRIRSYRPSRGGIRL